MELERKKRQRFIQAPTGVMNYPVAAIPPYCTSMIPACCGMYPFFAPSLIPGATDGGVNLRYSHNLDPAPMMAMMMPQSTTAAVAHHHLPVPIPHLGWSPLMHPFYPQLTPVSLQPFLQYAEDVNDYPVIIRQRDRHGYGARAAATKGKGYKNIHMFNPQETEDNSQSDDDFEISADHGSDANKQEKAPNNHNSKTSLIQQTSEQVVTELIFQSLLQLLAESSIITSNDGTEHCNSTSNSATINDHDDEGLQADDKPTSTADINNSIIDDDELTRMKVDDEQEKKVELKKKVKTSTIAVIIMDRLVNEIILKMLIRIMTP